MKRFLIALMLSTVLLAAPVFAFGFRDYAGKDVEENAGLAVLRLDDKYFAIAEFSPRKGSATFKLRLYPNDGSEGTTVAAGQFKPKGEFSTGVIDLRDVKPGAYLASLEVTFVDGNSASFDKNIAILAGGSGLSATGRAFSLPGSGGKTVDLGTLGLIGGILVVLAGAIVLLKKKPVKKARKKR